MNKNEFYERVCECVRLVPFGRVTTYGEIAKVLSKPLCAGLVKKIVAKEEKENIPIHRVVDRRGKLSNKQFCNIAEQKQLLLLEGVEVVNKKVDLEKYGFYFW